MPLDIDSIGKLQAHLLLLRFAIKDKRKPRDHLESARSLCGSLAEDCKREEDKAVRSILMSMHEALASTPAYRISEEMVQVLEEGVLLLKRGGLSEQDATNVAEGIFNAGFIFLPPPSHKDEH